jgi:transposase
MKPIQLDAQQHRELQRRRHETRDKRIFERLSALLWVADGKTRFEIADLLGRSVRQLADWLRLFRNRGLDALCNLHHRGDPGNLTAGQVERLEQEISTGRFRTSDQVRLWVEEVLGVSYSPSGIKGLLRRVGAVSRVSEAGSVTAEVAEGLSAVAVNRVAGALHFGGATGLARRLHYYGQPCGRLGSGHGLFPGPARPPLFAPASLRAAGRAAGSLVRGIAHVVRSAGHHRAPPRPRRR